VIIHHFKVLSHNLLGGRKTMKHWVMISTSGWDSNTGCPKHVVSAQQCRILIAK
jgi:hypothetical protein